MLTTIIVVMPLLIPFKFTWLQINILKWDNGYYTLGNSKTNSIIPQYSSFLCTIMIKWDIIFLLVYHSNFLYFNILFIWKYGVWQNINTFSFSRNLAFPLVLGFLWYFGQKLLKQTEDWKGVLFKNSILYSLTNSTSTHENYMVVMNFDIM